MCFPDKFSQTLFKRLLNSYNLDSVKSIHWGSCHEVDGAEAIEKYLNATAETGQWIHESGMPGAIPDRIVP